MKSVIQHLRFPFSFLLMPVYLFGVSEIPSLSQQNYTSLCVLFIVLHVLVYPSSNAYNSTQDQDQGSIGLIEKPLPPSNHLVWVTLLMDAVALILSVCINFPTACIVALYIVFSRLYSYRKIRIKKYPILGFLTVFFFQGAVVFCLPQVALNLSFSLINIPLALAASCLIGAIYPLSQIYQHEQDKADGVQTLSLKLGYRGTFIFSGVLFLLGTTLFLWQKILQQHMLAINIFLTCQLPTILFFIYWFLRVEKNVHEANYRNTMRMNLIAAACMLLCFTWLILNQINL
ncbi:MAG: UbiA prenyltransferase family protein [Chitinophagaceae bacterium]|nr:UbiA prenyltransferase family protein [Chitinophagaceae bacterium]